MEILDWIIVGFYLAGILALGFFIGRRQKDQDDYYVGGREIPPWLVGSSMAANQVSAISLIGAPAFIALKQNGGLKWLQYELAVPLAMLFIILFLVKPFRSHGGITIYRFLEQHYGPPVRRGVSLIFLLSRGLATGVALLAAAYVTSITAGLSLNGSIAVIGLISLVYTAVGGISADIISDAVQMVILWLSAIVIIIIALSGVGQVSMDMIDPDRLKVFYPGVLGFSDGESYGLLPMLLGGFFLYVSYYGCDQSQAQRILTTKTDQGAHRSLVINALVRFPLVLTYTGMGVALLVYLAGNADFAEQLSRMPADFLVPVFIREAVPVGLSGFIVAGIFAASMSSLDSAVNSLSASTWDDFLVPLFPSMDSKSNRWKLAASRLITLAWGAFIILASIWFAGGSDTVIELVNRIGSAFYGPVAAVFVMGLFVEKGKVFPALVALGGGVAINMVLWLGFPGISWLWWNVTGFVTATVLLGVLAPMANIQETLQDVFHGGGKSVPVLVGWFIVIVTLAVAVERFFL